MVRFISRAVVAALAAGAIFAAPAPAAADWPEKPVHAIVPFPGGSSSDAVVRLLAERLSARLGQPVVIENRPGAGGTIGVTSLTKAAPDGYTFGLLSTSTTAVAPHLRPDLPYDPLKDLKPISMIGGAPYIVVVYPGLAAKSLQELVALAKERPGKINFGSAGATSTAFLATSQFADIVDIDITHVPYKAAAQTVPDMLAGRLEMQFATIAVARPSVDAGKLRALAVTSKERLEIFPDVPTVVEAGIPDFEATLWFALAMPAGTPDDIVNRFNKELTAVLNEPETRKGLANFGVAVEPGPPEAVTERIRSEHKRWGEVAKKAGVLPAKK